MSLDENNNFVLSTEGSWLSSLRVTSESGAIDSVGAFNDTDPPSGATFGHVIESNPFSVHWMPLSENIVVRGDLRLTAGWNSGAQDLKFEIAGVNGLFVPIELPDDFYTPRECENCERPAFRLVDEPDLYETPKGNLVLSGINFPIRSVTVYGENLAANNAILPFARVRDTEDGIRFSGSGVFDIGYLNLRGNLTVPVTGSSISGVTYQLENSPQEFYLPANEDYIYAWLDEENRFVISGTGQEVSALLVTSPAGGLIPSPPGSNVSPFDRQIFNSKFEASLNAAPIAPPIVIDGTVELPFSWDSESNIRDVVVQYADDRGLQNAMFLGYPSPMPMACDVSFDFECNAADLDVVGLGISLHLFDGRADQNRDGVIDIADLDSMLANDFDTVNGDANLDGEVGFNDFLVLSRNFGDSPVVWSQGDFVPNGEVDFEDFLLLTRNFGESLNNEPANVPEPSGVLSMAWFLSLFALAQRRR